MSKKIAIFLPNWIGDVVMATPALRAIRGQYSADEIVGVMRPYVADVLAGTGLVDRNLYYNPRGKVRDQRGLSFLKHLRNERFDTVVLFPNSLRSGVLGWLSGAPRRIGFARDLRSWFLTDRLIPKQKSPPHPVMDEYRRLAEHLGCANVNRQMKLATLPEDEHRLNEFWKKNASSQLQRNETRSDFRRPSYVCLNTGGAFGAAKNWPREYFVELGRRIVTELRQSVLVVCGPSECDDARWIVDNANLPTIHSLADASPSIGLTKAAIRSSQLLVTTDSGPRHFAAAFGIPVVTLFGPTHIAWSETFYDRGEHLQLKLDCGPCQQRECPLKHHRCMRDMSVDSVFEAAKRQLNRRSFVLDLPKAA